MDDIMFDDEDIELAIQQGLVEEVGDEYRITEKGRRQLMYHYASNSEYVEIAQKLSEQQGELHSVEHFRVYFLRDTAEWFALVDGRVWITDTPEALLNKMLEYRDMQTQERLDDVRRNTH